MIISKLLLTTLTLCLFIVFCYQDSNRSIGTNETQESSVKPDIEFSFVKGGNGRTRQGVRFSTVLYKSSDGVSVSATTEERRSAGAANKELHTRLRATRRIVERGSKLDEKGRRIGERVVAIYVLNDKEQAAVLWTNGQQFYYIESLSLKHALEFERQFYR